MDDRQGYAFEDLAVGMTAVFSKTITEADLLMFAGVSGDTNPLHLDEEFASRTMFESRIAHGMLTASLAWRRSGSATRWWRAPRSRSWRPSVAGSG
jgi:3-hydroxybutyryl-CoA dehydratase